jgi:hypothetical protein
MTLRVKMPPRVAHKPDATEAALQRQQLQRLASQVRDEDHWRDILASATTPEQRDELERVVAPLLPFRRASACTTPDCDSGTPGMWQPVLKIASPIDPAAGAWVPIELRLCDACKAEATLDDFLTDGIWAQIMAALEDETVPPPTRARTSLTWDRIH